MAGVAVGAAIFAGMNSVPDALVMDWILVQVTVHTGAGRQYRIEHTPGLETNFQ
jgi:hypothetical protein